MHEESIHHIETNKGSQNDMCAPLWAQHHCLYEQTTCCIPQPHATPVDPQCPHSVLTLCRLHTHSKRRGNPGKPPACRLLMWNNWEHWGFSTIDVCQIIHRPKWCTPPPHYIFKKVPQFLPTPSPLTTALPSCFHFNTRAPSKKGRHLAHAFEDKK